LIIRIHPSRDAGEGSAFVAPQLFSPSLQKYPKNLLTADCLPVYCTSLFEGAIERSYRPERIWGGIFFAANDLAVAGRIKRKHRNLSKVVARKCLRWRRDQA